MRNCKDAHDAIFSMSFDIPSSIPASPYSGKVLVGPERGTRWRSRQLLIWGLHADWLAGETLSFVRLTCLLYTKKE